MKGIEQSIDKACDFLTSVQNKDGSFISLSSPDPVGFRNAIPFPSVFSSTLILSSLCRINNPKLLSVKEKCASFLLTQRSKDWSFNYWVRESKEYINIPYPDDLDDTFCALAGLYLYDSKVFDGKVLAKVISLLASLEVEEGGPYRTWLAEESADKGWKDVDFAVNANIAYFLSLIDIALPKLTNFLEEKIYNGNISSPYYPTDYPSMYFISRFYKGASKERIIKKLLSSNPSNPLDASLISLALMNFEKDADVASKYIEYILREQINGHWKVSPFYTGVNPKRDKTFYAGCDALTTSFCMEALFLYTEKSLVKMPQINIEKTKIDLDRKIIGQVKRRYLRTGRCLQDRAIKMIDTIKEGDTAYQITLTPFFFKLSLGKKGEKITDEFLIGLGCANLYGWIAYTIYDDFLDDEGSVTNLSVANVALRELSEIFNNILLEGYWFGKYAKNVIDDVDSANSWEVANARPKFNSGQLLKDIELPDYGNYKYLINRSFGHSLGPAAILFSLGHDENSQELKNLEKFFRAYIVAKQLNDDAHDWQEDFQKGHTSPVIVMLVKKLLEKNPNYVINSQKELLDKLSEIFWYESILDVCEEILLHVDKAKKAIQSMATIEKPEYLERLLKGVETGALKALKEQKQTVEFLNVYS